MLDPSIQLATRPCEASNLAALERSIPSGDLQLHHYRYQQQLSGKSVYLVAWVADVPVGHLDLHWPGYGGNALQHYLPDYAELNALVVIPAWQLQGIGTTLIMTAERFITARGLTKACLGVNVDNIRARNLYERLGYTAWDYGIVDESWRMTDEKGQEHVYTEKTVYLVKALRAIN